MSMVDLEALQKAVRVYRAAKTAKQAVRGYRRAKKAFEENKNLNDKLFDAAELAERVRTDNVRREDVRAGFRVAVNSLPRIYNVIAKHIAKDKG